MYNIELETEATKREIEIRGRILMMSCDIEYCLLNIIMFCNPSPDFHERAGRFKEMKMAAKINNVIADMKKYKPEYYIEFEEAFDGLDEFRHVRNDMCHSKGDFPNDPDFTIFRTIFVDKDASGIEGIRYREYTDEYLGIAFAKFAKVNGDLSGLWMRLYREFSSASNPLAHQSASTQC